MLELLSDPQAWIALATLTALELVLGIDNIVFISILVDKLDPVQRERARRLGLFMAMFMRVGLLLLLSWIVGLVAPLFTVAGQAISGRDLILIAGGLFLIYKSTGEIHQTLEGESGHASSTVKATFGAVIVQILIVDMVFSLDSIITAVGMVDRIEVMIAAVVISVGLMMLFASTIGRFVSDHPTIKMLALAFLLVVGVVLVAEGFDQKVPKGYVYFAMAFSLGVELLNIRLRKKTSPPEGAECGLRARQRQGTLTADRCLRSRRSRAMVRRAVVPVCGSVARRARLTSRPPTGRTRRIRNDPPAAAHLRRPMGRTS